MVARPTTTVGEVLSLTQGVLANPQVSNSIARLLRRSKQNKDISEALMAELQSGVLSGAAGAQAGRLARYHAQVGNFLSDKQKQGALRQQAPQQVRLLWVRPLSVRRVLLLGRQLSQAFLILAIMTQLKAR